MDIVYPPSQRSIYAIRSRSILGATYIRKTDLIQLLRNEAVKLRAANYDSDAQYAERLADDLERVPS